MRGILAVARREVIEKRTFKAAVDEDWKLSRQIGVTGVPTFVAGRYGVVGAQKTLVAGLPVMTALLLGTINAVGGGLVRDLLTGEEPIIFKPGEWYALSAVAGCGVFLALVVPAGVPPQTAALAGILVAFSTRLLSIRLGWRTGPLADEGEA